MNCNFLILLLFGAILFCCNVKAESCEDNNDQLRDDLQKAVQELQVENSETLVSVNCSNLPEMKIWEELSQFIDFPAKDLPNYCVTILHSIYNYKFSKNWIKYWKGLLNVERFPCRKTCGFCGAYPPEKAETTNTATLTEYKGVTCKKKRWSKNSPNGIKATCIKDPKCWAIERKSYCKGRKGPNVFTMKVGMVNLKEQKGGTVWIKDHCADHVKNQDEEGVDCGGACAKACEALH